jgi:RNA polymerase sigma factor (sigma-70 family)
MAQHDSLVHAVLRRQWGGTLSYEERLYAGRIGLWQAIRGYDPTRGTAFSTYAWPAIARQIWRAVRLRPAQPSPPVPLADQPPDPDATLLAQEVSDALHTLVRQLPAPLRQVVVSYYGLADQPPRSLRQISRQMGLSHEAVRLRLWAALVWLRHPSHSLPLRQLLDLNTVRQYQRADELAQAWLRKRGGRCAR